MTIINTQGRHNASGTPLSLHGYVICKMCGKEVQGISRETSREYAYCLHCRHHNQKEVYMPAVPKPSQAGTKKSIRVRGPRQRTGVVAKRKIRQAAQTKTRPPHSALPPFNGESMTAEQAAELLGVTIWRVRDLVRTCHLRSAEKGVWRTGIVPQSVTDYHGTRGQRKQTPVAGATT